jgi:hypothetical protein
MSKAAIILVISLALAVPTFASPSESGDPERDGTGVITRVLKQIKRFIIKVTEQPAIPIPQTNN